MLCSTPPTWADDTLRKRNGRCLHTGQEAYSHLEVSLTVGGLGGAYRGDESNRFVTTSDISKARSIHLPRLELHHLMIWSHCPYWWSVNNNNTSKVEQQGIFGGRFSPASNVSMDSSVAPVLPVASFLGNKTPLVYPLAKKSDGLAKFFT